MRRALAILVAVVAVVALVAFGPFGGGGQGYEVRAYFDNGDFIVGGEDVRIAGAKVGSVVGESVSVPGETVHRNGRPEPGKAAVVLRIDDAGFQDFRRDASCVIRPQSLLGEKYVDCSPTKPRAPGSPAARALKVIPSGQPGAGERFLPLENNGHIVDLDVVQNILRLPYADRFRLILNELGAGLAARGQTLNAVIKRADPALRYTDQVLHILVGQNRVLANLASNSDAILAPLARERRHVSGFIANAGQVAQATAERSAALRVSLHRFPRFLPELRSTMTQLRAFADRSQPVFADLGAAAPVLTRLTKQVAPFSSAARGALLSLGTAAAKSGQPLVAADPVVRDLRDLARQAASPATNLNKLLSSLNATGGFKNVLDFIYNSAGSVNGFDQSGHFLRAELLSSNCVDYDVRPFSGCGARWNNGAGSAPALASTAAARAASGAPISGGAAAAGRATARATLRRSARSRQATRASARRLLHFLVGEPRPRAAGHRAPRAGGGIHAANGSIGGRP
jgi:phospholipid/cholesterol/gamma-HCH transport system substrate-binding protein